MPLPAPAPAAGGFTWKPELAPNGPVSVIFSSADKQVSLYRNGVEIGRAATGGAEAGKSYGNHVYAALAGKDADGEPPWNLLEGGDGSPAPDLAELRNRLAIPPEFLAHGREILTAGSTLVITDHPVDQTTHSGPGFSILTTADQ